MVTYQDTDLILGHHITSIHGMTNVLERFSSIFEAVLLDLMLLQGLFATWMLLETVDDHKIVYV